jgi:hypothetical protein
MCHAAQNTSNSCVDISPKTLCLFFRSEGVSCHARPRAMPSMPQCNQMLLHVFTRNSDSLPDNWSVRYYGMCRTHMFTCSFKHTCTTCLDGRRNEAVHTTGVLGRRPHTPKQASSGARASRVSCEIAHGLSLRARSHCRFALLLIHFIPDPPGQSATFS